MFHNVKKISTKLLLSFLIVAIISSIPGIISAVLLKKTDTDYSNALVNNGFSQGEIGHFNTYLSKGGAVVRDIIVLTNASDIKASQQELQGLSEKLDAALIAVKETCQTSKEKELIAIMEAKLPAYREARDRVVALGLQNKNEEAMNLFHSEARPILNEITATAD